MKESRAVLAKVDFFGQSEGVPIFAAIDGLPLGVAADRDGPGPVKIALSNGGPALMANAGLS